MKNSSERSDFISIDEIFSKKDVIATENMPPRSDIQDYVFLSSEKAILSCDSTDSDVRIRIIGDLVRLSPQARDSGCVSFEELSRISKKMRERSAFRPAWLDVMVAPRIRPHRLNRSFPGELHTLVSESTATEWPWTAIGKLFVTRRDGSVTVGSGVLVGPNLLLTASHAMPWGTDDSSIRFSPCYRNGDDPRFGSAYVESWRGVVNTDSVTGLDYVICKLNWRIGERTGWLGSEWNSDEDFYYDNSWISVGYPLSQPNGGERPSIEIPIGVRDIDNDGNGLEIETHLFAYGGWSGGPLWAWRDGEPRVVGIESGYEKDFLDPTRTVFAGGEHMVNLVKYGWANWT
jgi:V8-like Glu-specific endopeptidase